MAKFPHCDSNVLHGPGACKYCDMYPERQQARIAGNINFTGEHIEGKFPCPAEFRRPLETINKWGGNVPNEPSTTPFAQLDVKKLELDWTWTDE